MKDTVYVFARAPVLGTVKRRLALGIGDCAALQFYRSALSATLRRLAADRRFRTIVAVAPDRMRGPWLRGLRSVPQGNGDLGQRMHRIAARGRRIAIVGSDIPGLRASDVARAFATLGRADACLGPAEDGGYWLVALGRRRPLRPFAGVRWSTEHALADTLANFSAYRVSLLRTLRDVDDIADFQAVTR